MPTYEKGRKTYKPQKTMKRLKNKKGGALERVAESKGMAKEEYLKSVSRNPEDFNLDIYKKKYGRNIVTEC